MSLGRFALRAAVGGFFIGHGTQKLFGWFDGQGLDNTAQMFGSLGLRPAKAHALAAGVAETGGGAGVLLGACTPLPNAALIATMLTAIRTVHIKNGPWAANQGYEYNAVLIAAAVALAETGPGSPSIDAARGRETYGARTAALALGLGVAGAVGAKVVSEMFPEPLVPLGSEAAAASAAPEPDASAAPEPEASAAPEPEASAAPEPEVEASGTEPSESADGGAG